MCAGDAQLKLRIDPGSDGKKRGIASRRDDDLQLALALTQTPPSRCRSLGKVTKLASTFNPWAPMCTLSRVGRT
jgi:hypothetical protein